MAKRFLMCNVYIYISNYGKAFTQPKVDKRHQINRCTLVTFQQVEISWHQTFSQMFSHFQKVEVKKHYK